MVMGVRPKKLEIGSDARGKRAFSVAELTRIELAIF